MKAIKAINRDKKYEKRHRIKKLKNYKLKDDDKKRDRKLKEKEIYERRHLKDEDET